MELVQETGPQTERSENSPSSQGKERQHHLKDIVARWRQIGAAQGLTSDWDIANFLIRHYDRTAHGTASCARCSAPLGNLCPQCRQLTPSFAPSPPLTCTDNGISATQPDEDARSVRQTEPDVSLSGAIEDDHNAVSTEAIRSSQNSFLVTEQEPSDQGLSPDSRDSFELNNNTLHSSCCACDDCSSRKGSDTEDIGCLKHIDDTQKKSARDVLQSDYSDKLCQDENAACGDHEGDHPTSKQVQGHCHSNTNSENLCTTDLNTTVFAKDSNSTEASSVPTLSVESPINVISDVCFLDDMDSDFEEGETGTGETEIDENMSMELHTPNTDRISAAYMSPKGDTSRPSFESHKIQEILSAPTLSRSELACTVPSGLEINSTTKSGLDVDAISESGFDGDSISKSGSDIDTIHARTTQESPSETIPLGMPVLTSPNTAVNLDNIFGAKSVTGATVVSEVDLQATLESTQSGESQQESPSETRPLDVPVLMSPNTAVNHDNIFGAKSVTRASVDSEVESLQATSESTQSGESQQESLLDMPVLMSPYAAVNHDNISGAKSLTRASVDPKVDSLQAALESTRSGESQVESPMETESERLQLIENGKRDCVEDELDRGAVRMDHSGETCEESVVSNCDNDIERPAVVGEGEAEINLHSTEVGQGNDSGKLDGSVIALGETSLMLDNHTATDAIEHNSHTLGLHQHVEEETICTEAPAEPLASETSNMDSAEVNTSTVSVGISKGEASMLHGECNAVENLEGGASEDSLRPEVETTTPEEKKPQPSMRRRKAAFKKHTSNPAVPQEGRTTRQSRKKANLKEQGPCHSTCATVAVQEYVSLAAEDATGQKLIVTLPVIPLVRVRVEDLATNAAGERGGKASKTRQRKPRKCGSKSYRGDRVRETRSQEAQDSLSSRSLSSGNRGPSATENDSQTTLSRTARELDVSSIFTGTHKRKLVPEKSLSDKPFICHECGMGFNNSANLKKHIRVHTGEKPFQCKDCGKSFTQSSHLKLHQRSHTGEKPYLCPVCGMSFIQAGGLKVHMGTHSGEKPFRCDFCDARFLRLGDLNKHLRTHTKHRPFPCKECGATFTSSSALHTHKRIHTGDKPYKCLLCDATFAHSISLSTHVRSKHAGERPFVCEDCGKSYAWCTDLTKHRRTHTGEKPYQCSLCTSAFARSDHLKVHMRKHTGEKPFKCDVCERRFAQAAGVNAHKKKCHGNQLH